MPEPLAHVYDLALRALDEQERRVTQLHARITPVLAAGGVGITLLTGPAFKGVHPAGATETTAVTVGLAGIAVSVAAAAYLLLAARLSFGLDAPSATAVAQQHGPHEFLSAIAVILDEQRLENLAFIERLQGAFTVMVCGMLVGVCGLAIAVAVA